VAAVLAGAGSAACVHRAALLFMVNCRLSTEVLAVIKLKSVNKQGYKLVFTVFHWVG
jgi:hypothetical protein